MGQHMQIYACCWVVKSKFLLSSASPHAHFITWSLLKSSSFSNIFRFTSFHFPAPLTSFSDALQQSTFVAPNWHFAVQCSMLSANKCISQSVPACISLTNSETCPYYSQGLSTFNQQGKYCIPFYSCVFSDQVFE